MSREVSGVGSLDGSARVWKRLSAVSLSARSAFSSWGFGLKTCTQRHATNPSGASEPALASRAS